MSEVWYIVIKTDEGTVRRTLVAIPEIRPQVRFNAKTIFLARDDVRTSIRLSHWEEPTDFDLNEHDAKEAP